MNHEEYMQWVLDAQHCLSVKYSEEEIGIIINWFNNIKGAGERDLIGHERVDAFSLFSASNPYDGVWNLYDSLMSRLWIYAPYILKEESH